MFTDAEYELQLAIIYRAMLHMCYGVMRVEMRMYANCHKHLTTSDHLQ
jgi:hypothetical protein